MQTPYRQISLATWHFEWKKKLKSDQTFTAEQFYNWARSHDSSLVPNEAEELLKELTRRFYFSQNNEASFKVNDILLQNPVRINEIEELLCEGPSFELASISCSVALEKDDNHILMPLVRLLHSRNSLGKFSQHFLVMHKNYDPVCFMKKVIHAYYQNVINSVVEIAKLAMSVPDAFDLNPSISLLAAGNLIHLKSLILCVARKAATTITCMPQEKAAEVVQIVATWDTVFKASPASYIPFRVVFFNTIAEAWNSVTKNTLTHVIEIAFGQCQPFPAKFKCVEPLLEKPLKGPCRVFQEMFSTSVGSNLVSARPSATSGTIASFDATLKLFKALLRYPRLLLKAEKQRSSDQKGFSLGPIHNALLVLQYASMAIATNLSIASLSPVSSPPQSPPLVKKGSFLKTGPRRTRTMRRRSFSTPVVSKVSGDVVVLDGPPKRWNRPTCCNCQQEVSGTEWSCAKCKQSIMPTVYGSPIELLIEPLENMLYEVGASRVSGPVDEFILPSMRFKIALSPHNGIHLLHLAEATELSVFVGLSSQSPVVAMKEPGDGMWWLLDTHRGVSRYILPSDLGNRDALSLILPLAWEAVSLQPHIESLKTYIKHSVQSNFKFGVLSQAQNQLTEHDLYNNQHISPQFERFLALLGSRIDLAEHNSYMGGLKNNAECSAKESVFTTINVDPAYGISRNDQGLSIHIMWHVCQLLPFTEGDEQQVARKRHIGNDVVVVIFRDHGTTTPFCPNFASQFNHVYIVVQPFVLNEETGIAESYVVQVVAKHGVAPFAPFVACQPFYQPIPREHIGTWVCFKCVNAELAAMNASAFAKRLSVARKGFLTGFIKDVNSNKHKSK